MKKKALSLFLAVVMVLSMMVAVPMTASATTVTDSFNSAYDTTNEFTISTANDLVAFAKSVYNGKNYYNKTVEVVADIALSEEQSAAWTGIGYGDNGDSAQKNQHFRGTFNGNGHIIDLGDVTTSQNHAGGLFRGIGDGALVKDFRLQGTISINGNVSAVGAVACRAWGSITLQNIQSSVNFTMSGGPVLQVGGLVGYIHHNQAIDLTIDGCVYDGLIDCSASANRIGGFIGSTGINSNSSRDIEIKNSVFAGTIRLGDADNNGSYYIGGILGHVRSSNANVGVNITLADIVLIGKITFANGKTWGTQQRGVVYGGLGDEDDTQTSPLSIYHTNVFYVSVDNYDNTEMPLYGGTKLSSTGGSMTRIKNNTYKKTKAQMAALTAGNFSSDSTMTAKDVKVDNQNLYYPAPAGLVKNGWIPSLSVVSDSATVLGAQIRCTEEGDQYSGIRFVSLFKKDKVEGAQTADANFGIIVIAKDKLEAIEGSITVDSLVAAGGVNVQATSADDSIDGYYRVNAVVYEVPNVKYSSEIVAYVYVAGELVGESVTRSIYDVADKCLEDPNAKDFQKDFCQEIVDYVKAQA